VVAVGGVVGVREAVAYLLAGASAVEVGTASFVEPDRAARLVEELDAWLAERGATVRSLIGGLET
jgi:dihydroorotate dehydrogenase (NAD+) catalytic subunit